MNLLSGLSGDTITALRDAGIAIAIAIVSYGLLALARDIIKTVILSNNKTQDKRWDDMMKLTNDNLDVQKQQLTQMYAMSKDIRDNRDNTTALAMQSMEEIRKRFDLLDASIQHVRT